MSGFGTAAQDASSEIGAKFILEVDNIALGAFTKVTTPRSEWGKMVDRTGADNMNLKESSGLIKSTTIKLTKDLKVGGVPDLQEFYTWHLQGSLDTRSGAIIILDRDDNEIMRYTFHDAWVSVIDEVELDATAESTPFTFSMELTVSKVTMDAA